MAQSARPVRFRGKWRIRWLDYEGRRRSAVCFEYADAERQLRARQSETDEVRRGLRSAPPADRTGSMLFDYWLAHRAPAKRSARDDRLIIENHLRPVFGKLRLREIGAEHVDRFVAERSHLAPRTIRNHDAAKAEIDPGDSYSEVAFVWYGLRLAGRT